MSTDIPSSPDRKDLIPPVTPVERVHGTGDAVKKQKDQPTSDDTRKKRAKLSPDGTSVELIPDDGAPPVRVPIEEYAQRYRELFGEEPPSGELIDMRV